MPPTWLPALCLLLATLTWPAASQRSLLHWRKDLEFRLDSYLGQLDELDAVIGSAVLADKLEGPVRVGSARFADLIIPEGALVLDPHLAQPTVRILANKTAGYLAAKQNELEQVEAQLQLIRRQLEEQASQLIDKGAYNQPAANLSQRLAGTWLFRDFAYGQRIEAQQVSLHQVNLSSVEHVINETYMLNSPFKLLDKQKRLYFEGAKTFWRARFEGHLQSGCCDRLRPLHTNRMMSRSAPQEVLAPVLLEAGRPDAGQLVIQNLVASQLAEQTASDNPLQLHNLIRIKDTSQPELSKTLIFAGALSVDDGRVLAEPAAVGLADSPGVKLELAPTNYLLRFGTKRQVAQRVAGALVVEGESQLLAELNGRQVNNILDLGRFVATNLVRLDRPATIGGSVQFDALPQVLGEQRAGQQRPNNLLIMQVDGRLDVGRLNGMRLPEDLVMLAPSPAARPPQQPIYVQGSRHFANRLLCAHLVQVQGLVNGLSLPGGVIPLHLNDVMGSVGRANLWFLDGISAGHVTVQSGRFDQLKLREVQSDAQNLLLRSLVTHLPDGSQLIRAPLQVSHLRLLGQSSLNGFRPDSLMELQRPEASSRPVQGAKTFLAPVEAADCWFTNINQLANWTSHLIRVDQPNSVQTVHARLAFLEPPLSPTLSSLAVHQLDVRFWPNTQPAHYLANLHFSPELYVLQQALAAANQSRTGGRLRVHQVRLMSRGARVNGVPVTDVLTLDTPFHFADRFVMVGKVRVEGSLAADRIQSNYPLDAMDLVQFHKYRVPTAAGPAPVRLSSLQLAGDNQAAFLQCQTLNGLPFSQFADSIMSVTRPQLVRSSLLFASQVNFDGILKTSSSLNGIKDFRQFAYNLKTARLSFEDGLQCNSVMIKV